MSFAILRTAKLKSHGNVGASLAHTFRTRETPNADPERLLDNQVLHGPSTAVDVHQALRDRLPEKHRKDAVLGIEYFVGASPEWFRSGQDGSRYFARAVDWLKDRHGAENVVSAVVHRDETSPHLVVYVVPRDESGRLNAKKWLGGKAALSKMQTAFANEVGAAAGLERGIEGSLARHTTIREYYAAVNTPASAGAVVTVADLKPAVEKRMMGLQRIEETPEGVAERITAKVNEAYQPIQQKAKMAEFERRRADELAGTLASVQKMAAKLQRLANVFEYGLTAQQIAELVKRAAEMRAANKKQQSSRMRERRI